jgi:hypothetical protein
MRATLPSWAAATLLAAMLFSASAHAQPPFPSIDAPTQQRRDQERKQILDAELASERQALAAARQELAATQPADKINALQETVGRHQSNINAIERERAAAGRAPVMLGGASRLQEEPESKEPAPFWDVYRRMRGRSAADGAARQKAAEAAVPQPQQQDSRNGLQYQHQN